MRYVKAACAAVVTVGALVLLAGSASATEFTSPAGTTIGVGTKIKAVAAPHIVIDGAVSITCEESVVEGEVTNAGGLGATVSGPIKNLTLAKCGSITVTVLNPGGLELHGISNGNGTLMWDGTQITLLTHNILGTVHCIYVTNKTDIGTLTGSSTTGSTARLDIGAAPIPVFATDSLCGDDTVLTGNYEITNPDYLDVDPSPAPGTTLTSPADATVGVGTKLKAESEAPHIKWDGTVTLTCQESQIEGEVTSSGASGGTVISTLSSLSFTECGKNTITVAKPGSLEIHASGATANGTVTSTGAEITALTHNILGTLHCIYKTSETHLGTLTGSATTGGTATWDIGWSPLPQLSTDGACKSDAVLTGSYKFTTPDYLDVD